MLYLGFHNSISNGVIQAKKEVEKAGGNCMQIFTSPPQSFELGKIFNDSPSELELIKKNMTNFPLFIHAKYILNFAKPLIPKNKIFLVRYVQDLNISNKIGAKGVVLHFGTASNGLSRAVARNNMAKSLISCLDHADKSTTPILETSSGEGNYLGRTIETMNTIYRKLPTKYQKRIQFCIDTCHIFVSGYPIHKEGGWTSYIQQFEKIIGKNKIAVVHLNDSATQFDQKNDRHAEIGEGYIFNKKLGGNINALKEILKWAERTGVPCVLETHKNFAAQIRLCYRVLENKEKLQRGGKVVEKGLVESFRQLMLFHKALGNIHQFQVYKNLVDKLSKNPSIDLATMEGVGKGTLEKVKQYEEKGKIDVLEEMKKDRKLEALVELQRIYGVGPVFAQQLIAKGYYTVEQVRNAYNSGKLQLNDQQIAGLKYYVDLNTRIPKKEAEKMVNFLQTHLGKRKVLLMGGFRLGKKDGKDLDIVIVNPDGLNSYEDIVAVLGKYIVQILESGENMMTALVKFPFYKHVVHVDFRMAPKEKEVFFTLYFGSGENFSRKIREAAKKKGYTLNEWGLKKDGKYIDRKFKNEKDIFDFLEIEYVKPEER